MTGLSQHRARNSALPVHGCCLLQCSEQSWQASLMLAQSELNPSLCASIEAACTAYRLKGPYPT